MSKSQDSKEWWHPKKLSAAEQEISKRDSPDVDNDFGSYKVMRETGSVRDSKILSHNDINPDYRGRYLKKLLGKENPSQILDVGCGLGFTTAAIKKYFPKAEVTGVDISSDAISYATENFADCKFEKTILNPDLEVRDRQYDLICAFEFYPFTRTSELEVHKEWLEFFLKQLEADGQLVIWQRWNSSSSIASSVPRLKDCYQNLNFIEKRLPNRLVGYFIYNRYFSVAISFIIRSLLSVGRKSIADNRALIISRKKNF